MRRIRQAAVELNRRRPAAATPPAGLILPGPGVPAVVEASPPRATRPRYEAWTLALGGVAIFAIIAVSFLIGTRIGWLRYGAPQVAPSIAATSTQGAAANSNSPSVKAVLGKTSENASDKRSRASKPHSTPPAEPADELVVYEKGKVIFRMTPTPAKANSAKPLQTKSSAKAGDSTQADDTAIVKASSTTKLASTASVWLSPTQADSLLRSRTEPIYPAEALAAHRAGNVVLEVEVAEDGSVAGIRTLSGDPLLASAAAEAVRNWRYQPYRRHEHASPFQTDVTLTFNLPN